MKHDPEELNEVRKEIDGILQGHRDILNDEPRILRPLTEARDAAATKYKDVGGKETPS